jgi:transposase
MQNQFHLGLDVSKRTVDVCLIDPDGKRQRTQIANSPQGFEQLAVWLHGIEPAQIHACLEPTGRYSRGIATHLLERGYGVSQVNSFAVLSHGRSKGLRSKNDKIDAFLLADYCAKEKPPKWVPAAQSLVQLRDLESRIAQVDEMIGQEKNRLEAGTDSDAVRADIEEHVAYLSCRKERLRAAVRDLVRSDVVLKRKVEIVDSIIGIGSASATRLVSLLRFEEFDNAKQAGTFVGLVPRQYRSGTSVHRRECISRVGSPQIRELLYFPAMVAMQHNPQMRVFADRLIARGKPKKVVITAVMRKLVVLATTLVRKDEVYNADRAMLISA